MGMRDIRGRDELRIVRHRNRTGLDPRALQRAAATGTMRRLRSGAYVPTAVWRTLGPLERMRLEAAAAHEVGRGSFVASHATAAALWEVPKLFVPDGLLHSRVSMRAGSRTEHGVRKHAVEDVDLHLTAVHGIPVTTLERTIVDLALTAPFAESVVAADWALRFHTTREALQRTLDELAPTRHRARARRVLDFADPLSGSVGESWSRVQIAEAGFPAPLLQACFDDARGLIGFVDFYWPDNELVGEFDGMEKFSNPEMLQGRTPEQALKEEKVREDRLRGTGPRVARWIWDTLTARTALAHQLLRAGLPRLAA